MFCRLYALPKMHAGSSVIKNVIRELGNDINGGIGNVIKVYTALRCI